MLLNSNNYWILLNGIKIERCGSIIRNNNFLEFWELATNIFSNTSIILTKNKMLFILTSIDKNLERLKSSQKTLDKKLNNLISSMSLTSPGLKIGSISERELNWTFTLNYQEGTKSKSNLQDHDLATNEISINEFGPHLTKGVSKAFIKAADQFKITMKFDSLSLNKSIRNTILALLQLGSTIIIGTSDSGINRSLLIEVKHKNYKTLIRNYLNIIAICNRTTQLSGKMNIISPKNMKKHPLRYSLGLIPSNHTRTNYANLIRQLPEFLQIN
ncbi:MAG: hypothetical protein ACW99A_02725 [Candidatus Kariarchaeaceae archaeon]|jgi:hypothetical protein